ncbi:MAG TPA: cysteine methyltransferase [Planctomycetaceae bacterium]|nr:cysteine methyltransferase [Planctomycetaceae bacterium]
MPALDLISFDTCCGWVGLVLDGSTILRVSPAHRTQLAAIRVIGSEYPDVLTGRLGKTREKVHGERDVLFADSVAARIQAYFDGEPDDFCDLAVDTSYLTPLGRQVFEQCRRIPVGQTQTYGELAAAVGRPGAARAVGNFMALNLTPIVVPCHRVVGSGGQLGGFTAPGGLALKRRLLDIESARH